KAASQSDACVCISLTDCRELWTILLGRSALREPAQIEAELDRHWDRLHQGLSYYKQPSSSSAGKVKENKNVPQPLKDFGLRISKLLNLDEEQSVQLLQCYLQEDYRGTRDSLKVVLKDDRQSQALLLKRLLLVTPLMLRTVLITPSQSLAPNFFFLSLQCVLSSLDLF
uniref:Nucleoporin Nup188 N-terminal domain-containing protein n=1 Tax=Oryzias latipes TaxID=8090 RepID=A0A3P9I3K8_ORYLA